MILISKSIIHAEMAKQSEHKLAVSCQISFHFKWCQFVNKPLLATLYIIIKKKSKKYVWMTVEDRREVVANARRTTKI